MIYYVSHFYFSFPVHRGFAHCGSHVGVVVLINPHTSTLTAELRSLLLHPAAHKHLAYGGHALEGCGNWVFHNDTYTLQVLYALLISMQKKGCNLHSCFLSGFVSWLVFERESSSKVTHEKGRGINIDCSVVNQCISQPHTRTHTISTPFPSRNIKVHFVILSCYFYGIVQQIYTKQAYF